MLAAGAVCLCALPLAACESTQDKSARLASEAKSELKEQHGLEIKARNKDAKVVTKSIVQDPTGVAVAVEVHNSGPTQVDVPIAITVTGKGGKRLFANDTPGLDASLVSIPILKKGETTTWVNNQITAASKATRVKVVVGNGKAAPAGSPPKISLSAVEKDRDADGAFVHGRANNRSPAAQRRLTISCVAVSGGKVTAAGRSVLDKLPAKSESKKPTRFTAFLIGNPGDAPVRCAAPAVTWKGSNR